MRRSNELNIRKLKISAVIATDTEPPELISATVTVSLIIRIAFILPHWDSLLGGRPIFAAAGF
jgi:hypothetical protein